MLVLPSLETTSNLKCVATRSLLNIMPHKLENSLGSHNKCSIFIWTSTRTQTGVLLSSSFAPYQANFGTHCPLAVTLSLYYRSVEKQPEIMMRPLCFTLSGVFFGCWELLFVPKHTYSFELWPKSIWFHWTGHIFSYSFGKLRVFLQNVHNKFRAVDLTLKKTKSGPSINRVEEYISAVNFYSLKIYIFKKS